MPVVHLQDGRTVHFPDAMPPDRISEEVAKLAPHTPTAPERTWTDTAVDALPMAGGFAGSLVGAGKWNPLGMAGAAVGGAGGEFVRQIVQAARGKTEDVPNTVAGQYESALKEGALQAGLEGGGRAVIGGGAKLLKGVRNISLPSVSPAVKNLAVDAALDLVPGGRTMRRGARMAVKALRGARGPVEEATPAIVRQSGPIIEGFDRYLPNVSASRAAETSAPSAVAASGPKVRAFSPGEERGISELDKFFEAKYGPNHPSYGNGTYGKSGPAELVDALHGQAADPAQALAASLGTPSHAAVKVITSSPDLERGRELGRLLQKLASGRGGQ